MLKNTTKIVMKKEELLLDLIKHFYIKCEQREKFLFFEKILKKITRGITICFVNSCDYAKSLCARVENLGHKAALLIGKDMTADERALTMNDFRLGKYSVLVTTNLLARGIDNTKVTCVINFDLPRLIKSRNIDYVLYLHRSGRCSRFGRKGLCFNIITGQEIQDVKAIEEYFSVEINEYTDTEEIDRFFEGSDDI